MSRSNLPLRNRVPTHRDSISRACSRTVDGPLLVIASIACAVALVLRVTLVAAAAPAAPTSDSNQPNTDQASTDALLSSIESSGTPRVAPGTGLTLATVLKEVLTAGFETRLANLSVDAARGDARSFAAIANPAMSLGVGRALGYNATVCGPGCSANQYTLGLSDQSAISDVISGKHGLRKDMGRQSVRLASLQRDEAIRVVKLAAKQQFASLVFSQARLRLSERVLASAQETERLVRARYNSGAPLPDLLRAEAVTLDAQQRLRAAQIQLTADRAQLALLMGRTSLEGTDFDESILTLSPPVVDATPQAPRWIEQAKSQRPDRLAAEAAVEQSETSLRLARRNRWPDIELQLGYTQQGLGTSAIQPPTVSIALAAPIPLLYRNQGQIDRALADTSARSVERKRLDLQIASAVRTSLAQVASGWGQAQNAEARLARARRALEMVRLQYQEGATSLVDLLEATGSATDAEDNFLGARESFWNQVFQLEYDAGRELVK